MQHREPTEQIIDHLFRQQAGKMVAVLSHLGGFKHLHLIEDIVQESFISAFQQWKLKGIPQQPEAWLMKTAKNKAIDLLRRINYHTRYVQSQQTNDYTEQVEPFFHEQEISDSELRMIFACCHPSLKTEDQIALTLKLVFSFSISEIARALVLTETVVQKRMSRAKSFLASQSIPLEIPAAQALQERMESVRTILYLLFNEGYSSRKADEIIRKDLCIEAMRCTKIIAEHTAVADPANQALLALMCLHASRFDSRSSNEHEIILLEEQNRGLWDIELMSIGYYYLNMASSGETITRYHLEAAIAAEHCKAAKYSDTNWQQLLQWYEILLRIDASPVILLNRSLVIHAIGETEKAIQAILAIPGIDILMNHDPQYSAVLGYLYTKYSDTIKAKDYLQKALAITDSRAEKELLQARINQLSIKN
ncbi:MAG: sigma-70 family RNA polymerase sigma factor [Chitinophagaceae bacterium]|nr:sigma-70 family RNA polymerase sigma factor [Chitinophagaceae bacterium]